MEERSPKYGLSMWTAKPVRIAAGALAREISTLEAHHREEEPAFTKAYETVGAKTASLPSEEWRFSDLQWVVNAASKLRTSRGALLDLLLPLRAALTDVLLEERDFAPDEALFAADVKAHRTAPVPESLGGLDLDAFEAMRILGHTWTWTRDISRVHAAHALGPSYLLSYVIEHPTREASALRADVTTARDHLLMFATTTDP